MHHSDLPFANILGVLEGEFEYTLTSLFCDQLDGLDDTIYNNVFNARVFSFSVFTDEDGVDVVIGGFVPRDGFTGSYVGEEIECSTESQIERNVAFADWGL